MLQELGCSQLLAISQFDDFGNILHHVDDLHLLIKLQAVLRIVSETDCLTDIQCSTVRLLFAHQYFNERGLSRTIVSHDAHLLITGKDIREIFQNLQITETLVQMIRLKNLGADVRGFHIQFHIAVVETLLRHFLQFVESFFPITRFMSACLGHTAHPLQLCAVQVIGTGYFGIGRLDTLLPLFQVIAVISFI